MPSNVLLCNIAGGYANVNRYVCFFFEYIQPVIGRAAALIAFLALVSGSASAHPHAWIDTQIDLITDAGGVSGLSVRWTFDEFNSADLIFAYDENLDGTFSSAEQQSLREGAFDHLAGVDYFLVAYRGNASIGIGDAQRFLASIDRGRLVYEFTVPIDLRLTEIDDVVVASFDSSYFIDFVTEAERSLYHSGERRLRVSEDTLYLSSVGYGTIEVPAVSIVVE